MKSFPRHHEQWFECLIQTHEQWQSTCKMMESNTQFLIQHHGQWHTIEDSAPQTVTNNLLCFWSQLGFILHRSRWAFGWIQSKPPRDLHISKEMLLLAIFKNIHISLVGRESTGRAAHVRLIVVWIFRWDLIPSQTSSTTETKPLLNNWNNVIEKKSTSSLLLMPPI